MIPSKLTSALKKVKTIPKLVKELDTVFSVFIRLRDSDNEGIAKCITCPKIAHWKDLQCGHFQSRKHFSIRWDEQNTAAQCVSCNIFNQGRQFEFAIAINQRYGEHTSQRLIQKKHNHFIKNRFILEQLINEYRYKVDMLKNQKGFV